MTKFLIRINTGILIISFFLPSVVMAKVYLDINAPATRRMPVAIQVPVPLDGTDPDPLLTAEVRDVIARDLDFSGVFRVLDPLLYLEDEENSGIRPDTFDFDDWELINAEALIKIGYFTNPKGDIELEFHLYDVFQRRELTARKWKGTPSQIRRIAHMFSNAVIKEITGEDGIFLSMLLYVQSRGDIKDIYVMDYDGENPGRVIHNQFINLSPAWWPRGDGLVYTSYKKGTPDLFSKKFGGNERRLTGGAGVDIGASFSPDGRTIAFMGSVEGNSDIYIMDTNGAGRAPLTRLKSIEASPTWSPDGNRIAFVSDRYGSPQIFIMNADGTGVRRITYDGSYNTSPDWSPDGDLIAYTSRRGGKFGIFLVNPDTLESRPLVGEAGNNEDPSWSPDGRFISFTSNRTGTYQIYVVDREGRREIRVTSGRNDNISPAWSPR
ncbi:Tol-Pal system beta propeller repeat protein TolB [bacterium]|nr:MAG: Tol-Pal system beta propeller repeat protein TolB [bacterium]